MNEIVEHIGGDFGVTVIYTLSKYPSIEFFAAEIVAIDDDGALYTLQGASSSDDHARDPRNAERFISGQVKWDGCSHINFGDEHGYLHLCGRSSFDKVCLTLDKIYERCGEIMKARGGHLLANEFECCKEP